MQATLKQDSRLLSLSTPLGEDVLVLQAFSGAEALSRPFSYTLDMVSSEHEIRARDIVGRNVTFALKLGDESLRYFNGYVRRFVARSTFAHGHRCYQAEMVPWLWFLSRSSDCRIFQEKSVPEIVEAVFEDFGFTGFEMDLRGSYPKRTYTVQYRESAFDFVSRLLEDAGIFYWFDHENGAHTLRLADHAGAYVDSQESTIRQTHGNLSADHITDWDHQYEFRSGKFSQLDYNFEAPRSSLLTTTETLVDLPGTGKYELFDYPGDYVQRDAGEAITRVRMEEEEAAHDVVTATATCRSLHPGAKFTLASRELPDDDGKSYVVTSTDYWVQDESHVAGAAVPPSYGCTLTCIPDSVVFRPKRETPRPVVGGQQTAVVVGPKDEDIYTDEYGRIKVQFHWDRRGKHDENSSCWVRVSQNRAGRGWGECYVPHPGQEVVVSFLEGDPDQPVVTGRLYNADNMPPIELPAARTQLAMRDQGGNRITMQGARDEQQIVLHSPTAGTTLRIGK